MQIPGFRLKWGIEECFPDLKSGSGFEALGNTYLPEIRRLHPLPLPRRKVHSFRVGKKETFSRRTVRTESTFDDDDDDNNNNNDNNNNDNNNNNNHHTVLHYMAFCL